MDARIFFALLNLAIALLLVGAVIVIATYLSVIPVLAFIALFAALTAAMVTLAHQSAKAGNLAWARTWGYWGCLFFGIAAIALAHRLGLLAFIPDLILVWLLGFVVCALWLGQRISYFVAQVLLTIWLVCTFLYGQSYLPGVAVSLLLGWPLRTTQGAAALLLQTFNGLVLAALYFYAAIQAQHYPLQFPPAMVFPLLASLALLWAACATQRLRRDALVLGHVVTGLGLVLLVLLCVDPLWQSLRSVWIGPPSSLAMAMALLVWLLGALLLKARAVPAPGWITFLTWLAAAVFLELVRAFPDSALAAQASALAAVLACALALRSMRQGMADGQASSMLMGSLLLVLAVCAAMFSRELHFLWYVLALWALASVLLLALWHYPRHQPAGTRAVPAVHVA
jgi:hypothetical protein